MRFVVHSLRFTLEALDPIHFPQGKAGNVLRGALGYVLEEQIFRPKQSEGPSGFADPPRPFVFRVRPLEGRTIQPTQRFVIEMNLFEEHAASAAKIVAAVEAIAGLGFGVGRGKAHLIAHEASTVSIDLGAPTDALHTAGVLFLTPTEIKGHNGQLLQTPEFGTVLARIRDRVSTLRALYGPGPLDIDFRAFTERAAQVRLTSSELQRVAIERTSTRTGQRHPLGGFTGGATYEGDLTEFAPYLHAASFTGVGRQTVWGKGEIACHRLD